MQIICVDPRTDPLWRRLIDRHEYSSVFHSPEWITALAQTYGFNFQAYVLLDHRHEPAAGIPFCRIEDMRGARLASLPFCDFCDPLVSSQAEWRLLSDALLQDNCPLAVRCLHNSIPLDDARFKLNKQAMWHGFSLEPELEALWSRLDSSARRAINKAGRAGVQAVIATQPGDMRHFFDMHLRVRKYKYDLLAQPYQFFERIWDNLLAGQRGFLMLAVHQERVIASVVYLEWQGTLVYKFSASSMDSLDLRPTDLLIWEGIKVAKQRGLRYFDFGLSDLDQDGLIRFKRKYADVEKRISFLAANHTQPRSVGAEQASETLQKLTRLLTGSDVPDTVTEEAGSLLYRFFA